jgi:gas vesicle protein
MKSFLFGLGLGIALGVLFAPMSGEEARENLAERANDWAGTAREAASGWAGTARETMDQGRECFRTGVSSIRNIMGGPQQPPDVEPLGI